MRRRIKHARVRTISLVPTGHNKLPVIYKGDRQEAVFACLSKMDEQGELTSLVYVPEHRDREGDIASASVVREMAHSFLTDGKGVDILHDDKPISKDRAVVVESFIVQKGDPRFEGMKDEDGTPVDPTGGWGVVIQIQDPELRRLYRSGAWNGVSLAGPAVLEIEKGTHADFDALVAKLVKALQPGTQDIEMNPEDFKKLLAEANSALADSIVKGITTALSTKPEAKPEAKPEEIPAPVFKGSITDVKALKEHAEALRRHQLAKGTDLNDPKAIENLVVSLTKGGEESEPEGEVADPNAERIQDLEQQIAKLKKASAQPGGKPAVPPADEVTKLRSAGEDIAKLVNSRRGHKV